MRSKIFRKKRGTSMMETGLIIGFVTVVAIGSVTALGNMNSGLFNRAANTLALLTPGDQNPTLVPTPTPTVPANNIPVIFPTQNPTSNTPVTSQNPSLGNLGNLDAVAAKEAAANQERIAKENEQNKANSMLRFSNFLEEKNPSSRQFISVTNYGSDVMQTGSIQLILDERTAKEMPDALFISEDSCAEQKIAPKESCIFAIESNGKITSDVTATLQGRDMNQKITILVSNDKNENGELTWKIVE